MALQAEFEALTTRLRGRFVERETVIDGLVCAALAGEHMLLLGPPGTAKSALARALCGAIGGANYFEWLLSKFSAPEELFGPIAMSGLKDDRYVRVTTGKLPEAHVAFLDEIFKANSGILNALLTALNERKFHNGPVPTELPLRMTVGASNELPEGPELAALYDRFLVRHWVEYVSTPDAFVGILTATAEPDEQEQPELTLEEWDAAREEVAAVECPPAVAQELYKLRTTLGNAGIVLSDRRWRRSVKLLRAAAWLAGETVVSDEHFGVLSDVLWDNPQHRQTVAAEVGKLTSSIGNEATKIADTLSVAVDGLPAQPNVATKDWQDALVALNREGNRAVQQLQALEKKARNARQKDQVARALKAVQAKMAPVRVMARDALGL